MANEAIASLNNKTTLRQKSLFLQLSSRLTVEKSIYILIFILALSTRFFDLGSRALHHDESLHAYFSWRYYAGFGYTHDPMMHGPSIFHLTALVYLLLGASDYTARVAPAIFGVIIVMLPIFLRKQLGQWGTLTAS